MHDVLRDKTIEYFRSDPRDSVVVVLCAIALLSRLNSLCFTFYNMGQSSKSWIVAGKVLGMKTEIEPLSSGCDLNMLLPVLTHCHTFS